MGDKKLSQSYHSHVYDNFLMHWKYIKREKVNGKWKYTYNLGQTEKKKADDAKSILDSLKTHENINKIDRDIKMNEYTKAVDIGKNASEAGYDMALELANQRSAIEAKSNELYEERPYTKAERDMIGQDGVVISRSKNWTEEGQKELDNMFKKWEETLSRAYDEEQYYNKLQQETIPNLKAELDESDAAVKKTYEAVNKAAQDYVDAMRVYTDTPLFKLKRATKQASVTVEKIGDNIADRIDRTSDKINVAKRWLESKIKK